MLLGMIVGIGLGIGLLYVFLRIAARMLINRLTSNIEDLEQALEKHREESSIPCRVELHNEVFFVYNNETNEFMAQGSTLDELRERIRARWADRKVSVVAGEDSVLERLKAQI